MFGDRVSFVKFLLSIVGLLGDGRGELRGVGELRAIDIPGFMEDNQHR
jgi:hypothetical protein